MRDPNRLNKFYNELMEKHKNAFPGWRFTQLIYNFFQWFYLKYRRDIFYLEDEDFIIKFEEFIKYVIEGEEDV